MALRKGIPVSKHGKHGKFLDLARLRCRDVGIEIGFMMDFGGVLVPRTGPAWQGCGCACQACQARPASPRPAPPRFNVGEGTGTGTVQLRQYNQGSTVQWENEDDGGKEKRSMRTLPAIYGF
jgi:hypothetical protein